MRNQLNSMFCITSLLISLSFFSCNDKVSENTSKRIDRLEIDNKTYWNEILSLKEEVKGIKDSLAVRRPKVANVKTTDKIKKEIANSNTQHVLTKKKLPEIKLSTYTNKNKSNSYSSQCAAYTKKGYRCSRTVKNGSYCWQHKG